MTRIAYLVYGIICHVLFLGVFAYMMAWVAGVFLPYTVDGPVRSSTSVALILNMLLLTLFGLQHSVMARPGFKAWWTRWVPGVIERSTYVLTTCIILIAMFIFWQPMGTIIWDVQAPAGRIALWALFVAGWLLVPLASLMINHFDLFGTRQVWLHARGEEAEPLPFTTPSLYKQIRHPLYVGWFIAFWAIPTMTAGHLLFATMMSGYILVALRYEERDLARHFGEPYIQWRNQTGAFIPRLRRRPPANLDTQVNGASM